MDRVEAWRPTSVLSFIADLLDKSYISLASSPPYWPASAMGGEDSMLGIPRGLQQGRLAQVPALPRPAS